MANISQWFGFGNNSISPSSDELPDIFPIDISQDEFVKIDVISIYSKILTDVVERTHGLKDKEAALLWDNCLKSSSNDGLLTMLAKAMTDKRDLFLVYEEPISVVREATNREQQQIRADYEKQAESPVGVYVSFKNYMRSDMLRLYSGLEYSTVASLTKTMNLAKAIQFKMKNMRGAVSLSDMGDVRAQAQAIAQGLAKGKDVLLDGDDLITTATPDLTSVKEAIIFLDSKRSFYLGLPESYINGAQTGGLNATGEIDQRAVERGLRNYFYSVIKPVCETLFTTKLTYKTQDTRQIGQALEALKTFELTSEDLVSSDMKKQIIEGLLDIDASKNKTLPPTPATRDLAAVPAPRTVEQ